MDLVLPTRYVHCLRCQRLQTSKKVLLGEVASRAKEVGLLTLGQIPLVSGRILSQTRTIDFQSSFDFFVTFNDKTATNQRNSSKSSIWQEEFRSEMWMFVCPMFLHSEYCD